MARARASFSLAASCSDLGPQHLDPRPEAGLLAVPGHGEERLRGVELGAGGGDAALPRDRLEVELPADEDHEIARAPLVLARRLLRVGRGVEAVEGPEIQDGLVQVRPGVEEVERADDLGDAGPGEAVGGEVDLLAGLEDSRPQLRQQVGEGLLPRALRADHRRLAEDGAEVVAEAPLDRRRQGKGDLLRDGLARRHATLEDAEGAHLLRPRRAGDREGERRGDHEESGGPGTAADHGAACAAGCCCVRQAGWGLAKPRYSRSRKRRSIPA
jgi:hypothetical protein